MTDKKKMHPLSRIAEDNENSYSQLSESSSSMVVAPAAVDRIPLKDKIQLGPIAKYRKYNRFPWKMLLHIVIVMLATLQVIMIINSSGSYSRRFEKSFYFLFMDSEVDYTDKDFPRLKAFFAVPDLR